MSSMPNKDSSLMEPSSQPVSDTTDTETNSNPQQNPTSDTSTSCHTDRPPPWYMNRKYRRYWTHHSQITDWFKQYERMSDSPSHGMSNSPSHGTGTGTNKYGSFKQWCQSMAQYHSLMAQWMLHLGSYYNNWYLTWRQHQTGVSGSGRGRGVIPRATFKQPRPGHAPRSASQKRKNTSLLKSCKKVKQHVLSSTVSDFGEKFEMEITEEMMEFFAQSAKHKKERAAKNEVIQKEEEDHIDLGEANIGKHKATVLAPSERPGAKRTMEMKQLYGKNAAMIHGMETAMQLNFDRNCDRQNPKCWPQLPIDIKF